MEKYSLQIADMLEDKKAKVASIIQTARVQRGWTQQELGQNTGMSQNTIARIENARFFPSMESLILISKILDIPLTIGQETF